jgi:hypothetical protein
VTGFGVSNRTFRVGTDPTPRVAARKRRKRPVGTVFAFRSSAAGQARIAIQRVTRGRRKGKRCVKPRKALRAKKRCKRYGRAKTLRRTVVAGATTVPFSGRVGKKALKRGRYRATLTLTDANGAVSAPTRAKFKIVR